MKRKELDLLKKKTEKELEKIAQEKRDEIMNAKIEMISGSKETNTRKVRNLRHELAQILTIKTIISKSEKKDDKKKGVSK